MKGVIYAVAAVAALGASSGALAQDAKAGEATAKGACMTCHDVAKKKMGPALKEAAAAAKKSGANADKVAENIKAKHSSLKIADGDLKNVAAWLLTL